MLAMNLLTDVNNQGNLKSFHHPFAYVLYNFQSESYCSNCLRPPTSSKDTLRLCSNCRLARYCNKECQRHAWLLDHKAECPRLKASFPHLPLTDVLFLARIIERLKVIKEKGDVYDVEKDRKFDDLMTHEEETRKDERKMTRFEKVYEKTKHFVGEDQRAMPEKEEFFLIFCRVWVNSHSIHASVGTEIGMALDLGISRYDHSCRPNATLVHDGFRSTLRSLLPNLNPADHTKTFISYVDVGRSKYHRRNKLWSQWYFWCECERCRDPDDDRLTSIKCSNASCPEPVIVTEDAEADDIICQHCGTVTPKETVIRAQEVMLTASAKPPSSEFPAMLESRRALLDTAKRILHSENIYLNRLITAYVELTRGNDAEQTSVEDLITVYENYKRYYPPNDRHVGYHLLHLIKALIERGQRSEAAVYAFEAMKIFEVSFGIEHPYYLKTLALWTYLDTAAEKSNGELLELMNFNYNRPVDITGLLESN